MYNNMRFIEHIAGPDGLEKVSFRKISRVSKIKQDLIGLEVRLSQIIKLVDALCFLENEELSSNDSGWPPIYDGNKIFVLKRYLRKVMNILKTCKSIEEVSIRYKNRSLNINNSLEYNLEYMESELCKEFHSKANSTLAVRNRSGRGAEHIGKVPNMFDYGYLLETNLQFNECFLYSSGFYVPSNELESYIRKPNPCFISKVIITSLSLRQCNFPGYNFKDVFDYSLQNISILINKACYNITFDSLKTLSMLYVVSLSQSNYKLSDQILSTIVRMAYPLGIDKVQFNDSTNIKTSNEYKELYKKKQLWSWICTSSEVAKIDTNSPSLFKKHVKEENEFNLAYLDDPILYEIITQPNSCKVFFGYIKNRLFKVRSIILVHCDSIKLDQVDLLKVIYSDICLPNNKYLEIQKFINKYHIPSPSFIQDELKRQKAKVTLNINHYTCWFPDKCYCKYRLIHVVNSSASFYVNQINIVNPLVMRAPNCLEIPLKYLILMLEPSLKFILMYRCLVYAYLKVLLSETDTDSAENIEIYKSISEYLNSRHRTLIKENDEQLYYLMKTYMFGSSLRFLYTLFQILSSKSFYSSDIYNKDCIDIIKSNIIELFDIYKLANKFKGEINRMDIDFTINKARLAILHFNVLKEYDIDFTTLLDE